MNKELETFSQWKNRPLIKLFRALGMMLGAAFLLATVGVLYYALKPSAKRNVFPSPYNGMRRLPEPEGQGEDDLGATPRL
jgi:hypothetical protein